MDYFNSYMSVDELSNILSDLHLESNTRERNMDSQALKDIISAAIVSATEQTRQQMQVEIDGLKRRIGNIEAPTRVEEFRPIAIVAGVECNESLDIVKSVPEFSGDMGKYVSWRQAATVAHTLFEGYEGSSKYYQAVAIIRNKVVGSADTLLSSYNTVLNFKAIIYRLDFSYGDKRSIFTLEHELSTLKQGSRSITSFYDEVEQKLTLIINKVIMTNGGNSALIESLNQKYRQDALRVFVSGLSRPMCDILFSCKPTDMPSALALAQELETNQCRYNFASTYWNNSSRGDRNHNSPHYQQISANNMSNRFRPQANQINRNDTANRNNVFPRASNRFNSNTGRNFQQFSNPQRNYHQQPEPMDIDLSNRLNNVTSNQQVQKRPYSSDRQNFNKFQRINMIQHQEIPECSRRTLDQLENSSFCENGDIEEAPYEELNTEDEVNFLRESPSSLM